MALAMEAMSHLGTEDKAKVKRRVAGLFLRQTSPRASPSVRGKAETQGKTRNKPNEFQA